MPPVWVTLSGLATAQAPYKAQQLPTGASRPQGGSKVNQTTACLNGRVPQMEFGVWSKGLSTLAVDALVVGIFEETELSAEAAAVDAACGGRLKQLLARGDFSGRAGETLLLADLSGLRASRVLLTGLGARKQFQRRSWRKAWAAAAVA